MGTWYTFSTQLIRDDKIAEKIERNMRQEMVENESFGFTKINTKNGSYFTGHVKNRGLGFIEWIEICPVGCGEIRVVWCDDEGNNGSFP